MGFGVWGLGLGVRDLGFGVWFVKGLGRTWNIDYKRDFETEIPESLLECCLKRDIREPNPHTSIKGIRTCRKPKPFTLYIYIYIYLYMCIFILYIYLSRFMYMYIYIHIYIYTKGGTD